MIIDHLGNEYENKECMCNAYGVTVKAFDTRIQRGATLEKALTTPLQKKNPILKDHLGNMYGTKDEMLTKYGITRGAFDKRMKAGWSIEKALTVPVTPIDKSHVFDHLGNEFKSYKHMASHYGLKRTTLRRRLDDGWPLEKALTRDIIPNQKNKPVDHFSTEYSSIEELCKAYNITISAYEYRINNGWSLEKTLTTPMIQKSRNITDHNGNTYENKNAMCKAYNITIGAYEYRINNGWSLEKTLTTPMDTTKKHSIQCVDHLGNIYSSETKMVKKYNLTLATYRSRIAKGWSLEKALTFSNEVKDHLGNEYETVTDMCKIYGITPGSFRARLKRGYTLEQALTAKSTYKRIMLQDPIYGDMVTFDILSERYHIPKDTVESRYGIKWRLCEILEISPRIPTNFKGVRGNIITKYDLTITARINENVYECSIDNKFKIMSHDMIDQYCIKKYKEERGIKDQG